MRPARAEQRYVVAQGMRAPKTLYLGRKLLFFPYFIEKSCENR